VPRVPRVPRVSRLSRLKLALGLPALGLVELVLHLIFAHAAPTPDDWAGARPRALALRAEAAGVVVSPWWAEPHARKGLGEQVLPLRDVARPDESRYPRLLEISAMGKHLPELDGWRVLREEPLGHALTARLLENPRPVAVRFDFTDAVEAGPGAGGPGTSTAAWLVGGSEQPCPWRDAEPVVAPGLFGHPAMPRRRHACGHQPWQSVGVTVQDDQRHRARRCVWSHPPNNGEVIVRFPAVPLGREIHGHMGIHWTLERERRGAPVFLDVLLDGVHAGQARHDDGQGWAAFSIPTGERAGKTAAVEIRLRTPDANERQICWEADTRD
jgi:hypothetical protein